VKALKKIPRGEIVERGIKVTSIDSLPLDKGAKNKACAAENERGNARSKRPQNIEDVRKSMPGQVGE